MFFFSYFFFLFLVAAIRFRFQRETTHNSLNLRILSAPLNVKIAIYTLSTIIIIVSINVTSNKSQIFNRKLQLDSRSQQPFFKIKLQSTEKVSLHRPFFFASRHKSRIERERESLRCAFSSTSFYSLRCSIFRYLP